MPTPLMLSCDAFLGDISHEYRYSFGVQSPYSPNLIVEGGQCGPNGVTFYGPFQWTDGNWYAVCRKDTTPPADPDVFTGMFVSADDGVTWTEVDAANHLTTGVATVWFDGVSTVIVAYRVPGAGLQDVNLRNFDLSTQTWGAVYATAGAPTCTAVGAVVQRPDSSIVVLYDTAPPIASAPASNCIVSVFSGGAWGAAVDVGVNLRADGSWIAGTKIVVNQSGTVMDSTGLVHFFLGNISSGVFAYQQFTTLDALGQYTLLTGLRAPTSGEPFNHPVVIESRDMIVVGVTVRGLVPSVGFIELYTTVYTGSPISAPVFTLMGAPGMDPNTGDQWPDEAPYLAYNSTAGILYATWPREDAALLNRFAQLMIAQTSGDPSDLTTWSAAQVFDLATDSPPGFNFAGQKLQLPAVAVPIAVPAVTSSSPSFTGGGGPFVIPRACRCDIGELALEAVERMRARKHHWPYKWSFPPPGKIRVLAQNVIAVPTVAAGETLGVEFTVDQGYMCAVRALVVEALTGSLLPGDFTWTLDLNRPLTAADFQGFGLQGLTNVDVPLGTVQIPWPLECPEILSPNDTLRSKFINVNLAPGAPNYLKTILLGWRWPVG